MTKLPNTVIKFEEINFNDLLFFKGKAQTRQNFFSRDDKMYYKTWVVDWENADVVEHAIQKGFFTTELVPNFRGIIKDKNGKNRGYALSKVPNNSLLSNFNAIDSPKQYLKAKLKGTLKKSKLASKLMCKKKFYNLIYRLFSQSLKTELFFMELSLPNLWANQSEYQIFDLDCIKSFEWIFCNDHDSDQFLRKVVHRHQFNTNLQKITSIHNLKSPRLINNKKEIEIYWKEFCKVNEYQFKPLGDIN